MGQGLLPSAETAPVVPVDATPEQRIAIWLDLLHTGCEDLIVHKLLAGRIVDLMDAAALLRANRATIDFAYLRRWIHEQALETDFARIWGEAFPGEPMA